MKICIAVETGGHLTEALFMLGAFEGHDIFIISNDTPRTRALPYRTVLLPLPSGRFWVLRYLLQFPKVLSIVLRERPDVIMSTGAEMAVPVFYFGKLLGSRTIFIESVTRISSPTITGRTVYHVTDLFLVQHKELLKAYGPKARYAGSIV